MPLEEDFETELRAALRREPAPAGFAFKLRKRLPSPIWRRPAAWAIAATLLLGAIMPPAVIEYRRKRQERALEAGRQLEFALQLTSLKLRETKARVQRATKHTI